MCQKGGCGDGQKNNAPLNNFSKLQREGGHRLPSDEQRVQPRQRNSYAFAWTGAASVTARAESLYCRPVLQLASPQLEAINTFWTTRRFQLDGESSFPWFRKCSWLSPRSSPLWDSWGRSFVLRSVRASSTCRRVRAAHRFREGKLGW